MSRKTTYRAILFGILCMVSYGVTILGIFFTNKLLLPLLGFIVLFISIYFFAIDLYQRPRRYLLWIFMWIVTLLELFLFVGATWHLYVQLVIFNAAIALLFFFLFHQLQNSLSFSAFSYFTEWGYTIAAMLTIFFSVVLLGKYSQIPFSCDDIDNFSTQLVEAPLDVVTSSSQSLKSFRVWVFPGPKSQEIVAVDVITSPVVKSEVELFFEKGKEFLQTQAVELQGSVSKNSCEFVMKRLKSLQVNEGFQLAVLVLMYFLLIGVFRILLWVISVIGFVIFLLVKPWRLYTYQKKEIQKESIG